MKKIFLYLAILLLCGYVTIQYFMSTPAHLYKIVSLDNWNQSKSQSKLLLSSMDKEFIHLSTKKQLDGIIKKFWADIPKFVVLKLDTKKLPGKLVFETNPGGTNKYYHLYEGFIPTESILEVQMVEQTSESKKLRIP